MYAELDQTCMVIALNGTAEPDALAFIGRRHHLRRMPSGTAIARNRSRHLLTQVRVYLYHVFSPQLKTLEKNMGTWCSPAGTIGDRRP